MRNQLKIRATVNNAQVIVGLEKEYDGGFAAFVWDHCPSSDKERLLQRSHHTHMRTDYATKAMDRCGIPAHCPPAFCPPSICSLGTCCNNLNWTFHWNCRLEADGVHPTRQVAELVKAFKKQGFKFLGETTALSFLQVPTRSYQYAPPAVHVLITGEHVQVMGGVNHHKASCFAYKECEATYKQLQKEMNQKQK